MKKAFAKLSASKNRSPYTRFVGFIGVVSLTFVSLMSAQIFNQRYSPPKSSYAQEYLTSGISNNHLNYLDLAPHTGVFDIMPTPTSAPITYSRSSSSLRGTATNLSTNTTLPLVFRSIKSSDYGYNESRSPFQSIISRLGTNSATKIVLSLPTAPTSVELRSPTQVIPTTISGKNITFQLPAGSGIYYLKTNVDLSPTENFLESVVFWVYDANQVNLAAPSGSKIVKPGQSIQAAIDAASSGSTIFINTGVFDINTLNIVNKTGLTLILHPDAVINQTSTSNSAINIQNSSNLKIKGPGEIRAGVGNHSVALKIESSSNLELNDFLLYKIHHDDGFGLHISKSKDIKVNNVKVISGNDGIDPDSSSNVTFNGVYIDSQDDGVAIKTRGGLDANTIQFNNGIVRSAASALKIGESTVDKLITNVKYTNSTVYDSDRAMVVVPKGNGPIGNILFQNIKVKSIHKNKLGKTIMVQKSESGASSNMFTTSNITFDNLEADFIETAITGEKIIIKNSKLRGIGAIKLFSNTCPTLTGINVSWSSSPGQLGCPTS